MALQSWQEKFYILADLYIREAALLKYAHNDVGRTRQELTTEFLDLSATQREALAKEAAARIVSIAEPVESEYKPPKENKNVARVVELRAKQRKRALEF